MTTKINTAQRDKAADDGYNYDGGTCYIQTGDQPASPNTALSGTTLCAITLPTPAFGAAATGVRSKAGTWAGTGIAAGTAGHMRLVSATGDRRMDLDVSDQVTMSDVNVVVGSPVTVTAISFTVPV